ncbi:hypothetical protein OG321_35530 [Streptomyces sp. NBC_00424]|uniref:hypothetical protein n=1 Tax=Streptomyces sp. NBC_00424 TaxID=2903648 RepID=UPI002256D340|nr:hypothetical protein [Streptomyces sp. NBC_00424]MCX5077776.1 hypothetical protein [Streptomyces sp. NBC_00424]
MTKNRRQTGKPDTDGLPHYQELLDGTDWASLGTVCGTGESLPAELARFLDPDPAVREDAAKNALEEVTHQNTIYEATVPVALYVAAVLNQPGITAGDFDFGSAVPSRRPTLVRLLVWLSDTAYDADDACVALGERHHGEGFLHEYEEMRAFRDLRPAIFSAVQPLLGHESADARDAALIAAIPLAEHPLLAEHRGELVNHARRLLATSTDRHNRDRVLDALNAWGHDSSDLENTADAAARERYARLRTERASWGGDWTGGYSEDPPF